MVQLTRVGLSPGIGGGGGGAGWVIPGSSLDLSFVSNLYYDGAVRSFADIFTMARASVGFAQDSSGLFISFTSNQPRRTDRGLLIENAATTFIRQNVSFSSFTPTNITVTTGQASPDGGTTAVSLNDGAVTASHNLQHSNDTFVLGTTYCTSIVAKAGTGSLVQLSLGGGAFSGLGYVNFNLSTGTVVGSGGTVASSGVFDLGNGWYRCWMTAVATANAATVAMILSRINSASATRAASYAGTGTTVFVWLPQTEAGDKPSSPIINQTSSQATRAADNITITGATAEVYAALSAYSETNLVRYSSAENVICNIDDGLFQATSNTQIQLSNGTDTATATIGSAGTMAGLVKAAYGFDGADLTVLANGGTQDSTAAAWGQTSGTIQVGNNAALTRGLAGYLRRLSFSPDASNYDALTV